MFSKTTLNLSFCFNQDMSTAALCEAFREGIKTFVAIYMKDINSQYIEWMK